MSLAVDALVRSSIVLAVGLITAALLRRQPAALRHWVLAMALALAAAQPLINQVIPAMRVSGINWPAVESKAEPVETNVTYQVTAPGDPEPGVPASTDWTRMAFLVWAGGAAISLAILLFGALWLAWLGSRATLAGDRWQVVKALVQTDLGTTRTVRVLVTDHPAMLVTWGVVAPVILLPRDASHWSDDRIRLVLAHEMAHLIRRDWMLQLGAELIRAIYWFNPLFWVACARLRRESEYACDDVVLDLGIGGTSYASHLIDLARTFSVHGRTWLPAPSIARPSTLERRVRAMLNPQVNRRRVSMLRRVAFAAGFLAFALPIAAASQAMSTPQGKVNDPMGKPLADAVLRLTPVNGGDAIETRTDAGGAFQFPDVASGEYMLAVRYPGFSSSRQRVQFTSSATTITLQVKVGTLQETISVNGSTGTDQGHYSEAPVTPGRPACTPSATGGQLTPPMKTRDVRPIYKQEWVDARIEGTILMQATIGKDGKVRSVDVVSPVNVNLEEAAMAAVSLWQFTPTYLNCQPIEVQMFVTVSFKADR
ncbi:MAG TPA: M56 family metallopeptidase [Vicinamibacterales bacterium]|nr:M56 family metallopeptidase [Vicinamibacterales bacterium]